VTDRIELWWRVGGSPEPAEALRAHRDELAEEVLAVEVHEATPSDADGSFSASDQEHGLTIWLRRAS
jgi:isoleucyl-tRNA synthetase